MSYCRWGEQGSTVYAYKNWDDAWEILTYLHNFTCYSLIEFRDLMRWLQLTGEFIPTGVFDRIDGELRGEDPYGEFMKKFIEEMLEELKGSDQGKQP